MGLARKQTWSLARARPSIWRMGYDPAPEEAAYAAARAVDGRDAIVVGVNAYTTDTEPTMPVLAVDPQLETAQVDRLAALRVSRDAKEVEARLEAIATAAMGDANLLYPIRGALEVGATLGEVSTAMRGVFGRYQG